MKINKILPVGLKGFEINERMKELMGINPINENKSTSAIELTKIGPDGNAYAIIRENREWYIKKADKITDLVVEDFKYIGGLQNKKIECYSSYSSALKRLNFKFKSLAEAHNFTGEINIVVNDNLISEAGFAGFSQHVGNGFVNEPNTSMSNEEYVTETMYDDDIELSEAEQAIEEMIAREELYGGQDKLDVDGDGEIEKSDLTMLRNGVNVKEMQGHSYSDDMENQTSNDDVYVKGFDSLVDENLPDDSLSEYSNDALIDMMTNLSRFDGAEEEIELIKKILSSRETNKIYENKLKKKA